ncbi:MAG: hypothetical protein PF961_21685 [Planctomycetota bacterium]|nr:hypothetical protein [Planctomycetota bacterium]
MVPTWTASQAPEKPWTFDVIVSDGTNVATIPVTTVAINTTSN